MDKRKTSVPLDMVKILVSHFAQTATEHEKNVLDDWICRDEENIRVYEQCFNFIIT